jgi:hypothetical protein
MRFLLEPLAVACLLLAAMTALADAACAQDGSDATYSEVLYRAVPPAGSAPGYTALGEGACAEAGGIRLEFCRLNEPGYAALPLTAANGQVLDDAARANCDKEPSCRGYAVTLWEDGRGESRLVMPQTACPNSTTYVNGSTNAPEKGEGLKPLSDFRRQCQRKTPTMRTVSRSGCPDVFATLPNLMVAEALDIGDSIPATPVLSAVADRASLAENGNAVAFAFNGVNVFSCWGGSSLGPCTNYATSAVKAEAGEHSLPTPRARPPRPPAVPMWFT